MPGSEMAERIITRDFELNTLDDVVYCFSTLEHEFNARRDKRAIFATAYLAITRAMKAGIEDGRFGDGDWVNGYLRSFAYLYVAALRAYEAGDLENVPDAWRVAFDLGAAGDGLVIQHLILGINAHVNHDLPFALMRAGIDPQRPRRYDDHTNVNIVLGATLDTLQDHVEKLYSPVLRLFDNLLGKLDDQFSFSLVKNARENAWQACLALAEAANDEEFNSAKQEVNRVSGELAELIARPLNIVPNMISSLASLEIRSPFWLLMRKPKRDLHAYAGSEVLPSLDILHDRLHEIAARYDGEGSEMAVFPAFYGFWLHILSSAAKEGLFLDLDWIIQLELKCASVYLRALADFEAGQLYEVPHGWASALYAAYDEDATIPQHLLLSINARMSHDVPLLLRREGTGGADRASRATDLEQWRRLFDTAIETVGADLVRKYRQHAAQLGIDVDFPDRLLDLDFLDDVDFILSTEAGFQDSAGDQDGSEEIAIEAAVRAHKVLTRQHISAPDLTNALKQIEAHYTGNWSAWI